MKFDGSTHSTPRSNWATPGNRELRAKFIAARDVSVINMMIALRTEAEAAKEYPSIHVLAVKLSKEIDLTPFTITKITRDHGMSESLQAKKPKENKPKVVPLYVPPKVCDGYRKFHTCAWI